MTVQFSGGEPTISPIFLDAVRYAREVGYFSVQAATNGIRFAQEPEFARQAREAGMRIAYLQFDGVSEEANAHRKVGNLFDVKLRAIENLYAAGIDVCLVVTIVNTVNNDQVGPIVKFALQNCDKISFVSFQPVSFTGRDEEISDEERHAKRYTLSHLAEDMKRQTGVTEPLRDWFPLSASSVMSRRHRSAARARAPTGDRSTAAAIPTAASAWASWSARRRRSGRRSRSSSTSNGSCADAQVIADSRPRHGADGGPDGAQPAAQLQPGRGAGGLPADRSAAEVRQAERRAARRTPRRVRRTATARTTNGC